MIKNLIADQVELQEDVYNKIKSVRRVGALSEDQPLLTFLTLETSETRHAILRNSFKLKYITMTDKKCFHQAEFNSDANG